MFAHPEKSHTQGQDLYTQVDITTRCRFSKSHLYNLIERGHFPPAALRCGPRFTRWKASDVQAWLADPQGWINAHANNVQAVSA